MKMKEISLSLPDNSVNFIFLIIQFILHEIKVKHNKLNNNVISDNFFSEKIEVDDNFNKISSDFFKDFFGFKKEN